MSASHRNVLGMNGFDRGSLAVAEAWQLYRSRYSVPPDLSLPNIGGWKMDINGISIPPAPTRGSKR
jgi:hypothetical protein